MRHWWIWLGLASTCVLSSSCLAPRTDDRPNFVLVLVDTLRPDHLGSYGYERVTSPFIDQLGAAGSVFENAVAQAPWTAPSMASLWTSRHPSEAGAGAVPGESGIRNFDTGDATAMVESLPTLAESLAANGYVTMAATANVWASDFVAMLRGFSIKSEQGGRADEVFGRVRRAIDEHMDADSGRPFFAYVHLLDVHTPIDPPPPYDALFATLDGKPHETRHKGWEFGNARALESESFEIYKSHKLALYDGAIAYVDAQVRSLHEHLQRRGAADQTVWIIASDHGEEFWDSPEFEAKFEHNPSRRGAVGHGHSLLRELLDVPLIFSGPGVPARRDDRLTRNLDIAPTVLALAGVESPESFRGVDLLSGEVAEPSVAFSEEVFYGYEAHGLQFGRHKYIRYPDHPERPVFLFDLGADPQEARNLAEVDPQLADEMSRRLARVVRELELPEQTTVSASPRELKRLMALGYLNWTEEGR